MPSSIQSAGAIGKNALWSMFNHSVSQLLVLSVFLVTARFVSKEAFGTMAICFMVIDFFRNVTIESVGITLTARKDPTQEDYNAGFILILVGSIFSALIAFIFASPLADFLKNPDIEPAVHMTCIVLLTMGLSRIHETRLAKSMKFKILAIRSIASISIGGAIGIYMAIKGYGLASLITQQIVTAILGTIFLWLASDWRPSFRTNKSNIKSVFDYSRHIASSAVVGYFSWQSDVLFSSYYLGPAATGVYNTAKRIVIATQLIVSSALNSVALPVLSVLGGSGDNDALRHAWFKGVTYTAALTAPFYMGLSVLSHDIILLVLGDKWVDAAPVLAILCLATFFSSIEMYNTNIAMVKEKPHWLARLALVNAIVNVIILFAVSRYGLVYVASALALKMMVIYPISLNLALSLVQGKLADYFKGLVPTILAAIVMGVVLDVLAKDVVHFSPAINLVILVPLGVAIYFGVLFSLNRALMRDAVHIVKNWHK